MLLYVSDNTVLAPRWIAMPLLGNDFQPGEQPTMELQEG
jgi:hypothetical protein